MEQKIRPHLVSPSRKEDLEKIQEGNLVKITLPDKNPKWIVYEGEIGGRLSFIQQKINDAENPHKILSHRSYIRYLKFDNERGAIFSHIHYDIVVYESGENYWKARKMLKDAEEWKEFEMLKRGEKNKNDKK